MVSLLPLRSKQAGGVDSDGCQEVGNLVGLTKANDVGAGEARGWIVVADGERARQGVDAAGPVPCPARASPR